ncbi:M23 family metallopeptidase [Candidatus Trichorickettsia mobilis]|uniref:M23 family metallopeptidase n=1 Tax=Candidatus Trichorickettsia mobilis TaxID=1346319 RepID=A0ABZ0UYF4_9RICK|nr:M23 family metallopeptidase [Candidatus Trichorickettsia mobilis]WPY01094.1 M23 family metallopeptidase [Candidatus Trichorickettsia mobilis]
MNNILLSLLLIFMICGCVTQQPAPIEYKNTNSYNKDNQTINASDWSGDQDKTIGAIKTENAVISQPLPIKQEEYEKISGELHDPYHDDESIVMPQNLPDHKLDGTDKLAQEQKQNLTNNESNDTGYDYLRPVKGEIITKFGEITNGKKSNGIDIAAAQGSAIVSVAAGEIVYAGFDEKFGNLVIVKLNNNNLYVAYAHMNDLMFSKGEMVKQGDLIGHVGSTGHTDMPKLHFAIREGKTAVNPLKYIPE